MKKAVAAAGNPVRKVLVWALLLTALAPAFYADSTLTPAQNIKTLYLRACLFVVSILFVYLLAASKDFRTEMRDRLAAVWKHPITKVMAVLFAILLVSTIFSYNHFIAILGEPEREEGFLGLAFFYSFFLYAILLFKKKEWHTFFWLTLSTQIVVFSVSLYQLSQGLHRTNSVLGNPIYFAVYGLSLMVMSAIMWLWGRKENSDLAKTMGMLGIIIGVAELFLGNTRSVLLGVVIAIPVALIYAAVRAEALFPQVKKSTVRKTAAGLFGGLALFAGLFFATLHADFWTHIPGLDRISQSTVGDATTQSRLASWSIAVHSINPASVGITRSLFGWGWDNYFFAWQSFYQSRLYEFDSATFDHPHNKLLDMLVMNGILGLIAYLALWFFFVRAVVHYGKREPGIALLLVFWSIAYFVQNLFAFDTAVSWIISFALFGFIMHETLYVSEK